MKLLRGKRLNAACAPRLMCLLTEALYVLGAGQHGLGPQDNRPGLFARVYAAGLTKALKSALVLRELRSQDAGGRYSTDPS